MCDILGGNKMNILPVIVCTLLLVCSIYDVVIAIRSHIYQKKWDDEKANLIRIDPAVTAHELCARYVDFCARNNCKVEY